MHLLLVLLFLLIFGDRLVLFFAGGLFANARGGFDKVEVEHFLARPLQAQDNLIALFILADCDAVAYQLNVALGRDGTIDQVQLRPRRRPGPLRTDPCRLSQIALQAQLQERVA